MGPTSKGRGGEGKERVRGEGKGRKGELSHFFVKVYVPGGWICLSHMTDRQTDKQTERQTDTSCSSAILVSGYMIVSGVNAALRL